MPTIQLPYKSTELQPFRALWLFSTFLISSCLAHAFIYLADLLHGITSTFTIESADPSSSANVYFQNATRAKTLATFFLYVFNVSSSMFLFTTPSNGMQNFCNNLFVVRPADIGGIVASAEARSDLSCVRVLGAQ